MATLNIDPDMPLSSNTVSVSIIDTTAGIKGVPTGEFFGPTITGHQWLAVPVFSFLIQHSSPNAPTQNLLFDLGIRKDWKNLSPAVLAAIDAIKWTPGARKSVSEILQDGGVDASSIDAVICSHYHFDHIGDPSLFGAKTALVVGPGFRENLVPGYPSNPNSPILESDYTGRELVELDFEDNSKWKVVTIGPFRGIDYFRDGSFYLLDSPGHAIGHISALARVTSSIKSSGTDLDSFVLVAGDAFHYAGELRPSPHVPLPATITPNPFEPLSPSGQHSTCPGAIFQSVLPGMDCCAPIYKPCGPWHHDADEGERTIQNLQQLDAEPRVLILAAHDESLLDVLDFFPAKLDGFAERGWVGQTRWRFLKDFAQAVGRECQGVRRNSDWAPPPNGSDV
ncbi:beta-lactamase-like protein [Lasiosphaeria hispida]|uniref:Beta-lactamase-like protein n=1 Tax=Lasiosphaeria hispida TaxID=260671 RepID=A0AAJ0HEG7_9PEZI|nr:beta-lactamase-like protein [Lasiosphaeria hispida]